MNPGNYFSGYIVLDVITTFFNVFIIFINLSLLMVNIKIYSEILKVKALTKEELKKY